MCSDVSVGMAAESLDVLDLDAAEHEPAPRFERMEIESVAYAETRRHCSTPRATGALIALRPTAVTIAISAAKLFSLPVRRIARDARICQEPEIHHRHARGPVRGARHLRKLPDRDRH